MNRRAFVRALVGLPIATAALPMGTPPAPVATSSHTAAAGSSYSYQVSILANQTSQPLTITMKTDTGLPSNAVR